MVFGYGILGPPKQIMIASFCVAIKQLDMKRIKA